MATLFKRYPKTDVRQIIDYNRFIELTGEKVFICIDRGILEIMRYLLNSRGTWQSTYATEHQEHGYLVPTLEQMDNLNEIIAEANIDMSTCDEIVTALEGIKNAIASSGTGGSSSSSGCCGGVGGDTELSDLQPPGITTPGLGDFPPLFEDEESYVDYLCKAAQYMTYNYCAQLRNFSTLSTFTGVITLSLLTTLLLLSIPPIGLLAVGAGLSTIALLGVSGFLGFATIADCIEARVQDIVCSIKQYRAVSGDSAYAVSHFYSDYVLPCIDELDSEIDLFFYRDVMQYLFNIDTVYLIYEPTAEQRATIDAWTSPYELVDCNDCGATGTDLNWSCLNAGAGVSGGAGYAEWEAEDLGSSTWIFAIGLEYVGQTVFSDITAGAVTVHSGWTGGLTAFKDGDATFCGLGSGAAWTNTYGTYEDGPFSADTTTLQYYSSTPFTIKITVT
jgi:hypothetical protein